MEFIRGFVKYIWAIAAAGLLTGCVRFQPKPISPEQTVVTLESRSLSNLALKPFLETNLHRVFTNWPAASWDFDMLTLAAFYNHPSLDVARADWRVAAGGIKTARELPNPTATWSLLYEPVPDAFSPWIPGLVFDLPIETAGKRRLRTEQARHLSESARLNVATAAWQVRSQVRASLLDFVVARRRAELLQRQAALRQDFVRRLQSQLQTGAISAIELNAARLALIRARADLTDAQRLLAEARPRLAGAMGLPATALQDIEVQLDLTPPADAEALTASNVRRLALLGRADILAALADYAAAQSVLQLEVAKQYPDIHLAPGYFFNAGSAGENDWQIGATVELPLLNQHKGAIGEATARREASAARFLALQVKVMTDIDIAIASFRADQTNLAAIEELASAQAAQQRKIKEQLQAGAVDRLELLTAELELSAVDLTRLDALVKLQQAMGALEDAVQRPLELPRAIFESKPGDAH
jgi:outer membrane protein, heavy metal efflux system